MLNQDYTEKLLGIKGVNVSKIESFNNELHIYFSLDKKEHNCPSCHQRSSKVNDYRTQPVKDISMRGQLVILNYNKRRYRCTHCNKRFYETNSFLPKYHRMSTRLIQYIVMQMKTTHSMTDIAKLCNLSIPTIFRIFKYIDYSMSKLPKVLSIDEFKGNAGNKKYQCILTDPENKKVLDILSGREQHVLSGYFREFKDRDKVEYFVMDMWKPYLDIARTYFKKATIVIDKFHYVRHIIWAFERVRKQVQSSFHDTRRKYFKRSRFLLLKRRHHLTDEQVDQVDIMLKISRRLQEAYLLKEKFLEFVDAQNYEDAKEKLKAWYMFLMSCNEKEFETAEKTIRNWEEYILNSFKCKYTNAYTEGVNNKVKVLKRNAYGYRNFKRFRNRILHVMN